MKNNHSICFIDYNNIEMYVKINGNIYDLQETELNNHDNPKCEYKITTYGPIKMDKTKSLTAELITFYKEVISVAKLIKENGTEFILYSYEPNIIDHNTTTIEIICEYKNNIITPHTINISFSINHINNLKGVDARKAYKNYPKIFKSQLLKLLKERIAYPDIIKAHAAEFASCLPCISHFNDNDCDDIHHELIESLNHKQ